MINTLRLLIVILALFQFSCSKSEKTEHGCSWQASEKVYLGQLNLEEVVEISFLESSQGGLYPVPNWEDRRDDLLTFRERNFFEKFDKALRKNSFSDGEYIRENVQTLHILIKLRGKADAYLCGFASKKGFYLGPMFEHDSYGGINNAVLRLYLSEKENVDQQVPEIEF